MLRNTCVSPIEALLSCVPEITIEISRTMKLGGMCTRNAQISSNAQPLADIPTNRIPRIPYIDFA